MKTTSYILVLVLGLVLTACNRDGTTASTPNTPTATGGQADRGGAGTSTATTPQDRTDERSAGGAAQSRTPSATSPAETSSTSPSQRRESTAGRSTTSEAGRSATGTSGDGSLTGCLNRGDAAGSWTLTDENGRKVTVTGTADFEKHVGHRVRLHGSRPSSGGMDSFQVTRLEHIAATCTGTGTGSGAGSGATTTPKP